MRSFTRSTGSEGDEQDLEQEEEEDDAIVVARYWHGMSSLLMTV